MAFYSDELIEEVIAQNDIVDVISEYVSLKKSGRNFLGLCPFHREKTPSFHVSIDKQIFKCFGCAEGGNVISFIMKVENLDFWDSTLVLAERSHIDLSRYEIKGTQNYNKNESRDLKDSLYKLQKDAAIFFNNILNEKLKERDNIVKNYISKRNLNASTITKFGIGFCDDKKPLYDYLISKGYTKEEILASGMVVLNDRGNLYNRFQNRLIFPIFDIRDRVIGFGGRVLDNTMPKYVNSPENEIYSKGKNLYALNFAKREKISSILIVEGYMDAVSLHKNGINYTVASLGTALTENQARLLKKYTDNIIVGYDQDSAGQEATLRGLEILVAKNLNVKVLKLDKGDAKDPDEYINKYGVERFENCLKNSISLAEFKIYKIENSLDTKTIDGKIEFLKRSAEILAKIESEIEREIYVDIITQKYGISKDSVTNEINKKRFKDGDNKFTNQSNAQIKPNIKTNENSKKLLEQYIILLMLTKDKSIREEILKNVDENSFENENLKGLYSKIIEISSEHDLNKVDILTKLKDDDLIKTIAQIIYLDNGSIDKQKLLKEVIRNNRKNLFKSRRNEILDKLKQNITKDEQEVLQFELNEIILELSKLK